MLIYGFIREGKTMADIFHKTVCQCQEIHKKWCDQSEKKTN